MFLSYPLSHYIIFFFNDTATTEIYTLSLHDALPIYPGKPSRDLLQHVSRPDSPTMAREQSRAPPRHSHGDPTSLAPPERLTDLAVVPREKPHTGAAAREQPRDSPVIERGGPLSPAWPSDQSRDLSPNASGGLTPLSPPSELQEIPVAIREQSGVLCFHSR